MLTKRHLRWRCVALMLGPAGLAACGTTDKQETVFCYRTLADVSCYVGPDKGRDEQLVGVYLRDQATKAMADGSASGSQGSGTPEEPDGWLVGLLYASVDLVGRVLTPVGPIVGLFR